MGKCYIAFTTLHMSDPNAARMHLDREEWIVVYSGKWGEPRELVHTHAEERIRLFARGYPYLRADLLANIKVVSKTMASLKSPFRWYRTRILDREWIRRVAKRSRTRSIAS